MAEIKCCYVYDNEPEPESDWAKAGIGKECPNLAHWVIWDGLEPKHDHLTYSCSIHIGELFDAATEQPHTYWPIEWD